MATAKFHGITREIVWVEFTPILIHIQLLIYMVKRIFNQLSLFSPQWLDLVSITVVWLNWCICFIINSILKLPGKSNYPERYKVMNLCHAQRNCISGFKKRFHWIFFISIAFLFFLFVCGFCVWFYFVYLFVCFLEGGEWWVNHTNFT